jgi:hypothetical protein
MRRGTHAVLTALPREVLEPKLAEHRGRLVKTTGDGCHIPQSIDRMAS